MTNTHVVETDLMAKVAAAEDEAALEAVRVAALGKSGVISGLLASLGRMQPEERKAAGAAFNALRDRVQTALAERKEKLAAYEQATLKGIDDAKMKLSVKSLLRKFF